MPKDEAHKPLRVKDLMSREVKTLERNEQLQVADDLMTQQRVRHLPVVGDDGELAGILSQRDMFRSALGRVLGYGEHAQDQLYQQLVVKEVMTHEVVSIGPNAPLAEAAQIMLDRQIGCLVVVDGDRIEGILTEGDFVRAYA